MFTLRRVCGLALLLLATGRVASAQTWLPAATAAAQAELAADWGHSSAVTLATPAVQPLATPGLTSWYRAAVQGTPWVAWGLVKNDGTLAATAIARATDPASVLSVLAADLAVFWQGEGPFMLFFGASGQLHDTTLSVEVRASYLRAVLDLRLADPTRSPGTFCEMASPFLPVVYDGGFPVTRVSALVGRAVAEWNVGQPPHEASLSNCPGALYTAVALRLRDLRRPEESGMLQGLLQQIVGAITASDRSEHPGFVGLLRTVVTHHLYVCDFWGHPLLAGRDPFVVHGFLRSWWQARDPDDPISDLHVEVAQRLAVELPLAAVAERAEARGWALLGLTSLIAELQTHSTLGFAQGIIGRIAGTTIGQGDTRWFRELDPAVQSAFVRMLLKRYDAVDFPAIERPVLRFLAWLLVCDAVPAEHLVAVRALLEREIGVIIQRRLATPLPPLDIPEAELEGDLVTLAELVKATGVAPPVEPLLAAWLTAAPGETAEHLAERRSTVAQLLAARGVMLLDGAQQAGRDLGFVADLDRYLAVADPRLRFSFSLWILAHSPVGGGFAGSGAFYWLFPVASTPDEPQELNYSRLFYGSLIQHEVGHLVHGRFPPDVSARWVRLYERTSAVLPSPDAYDPDHHHAELPGYAATEANEDAAEHIASWTRDNPTFLARAVTIAQQTGKLVLLEKYLILAEAFSRKDLGGGDAFAMTHLETVQRPWEEGGNELRFRLADFGRVLEREAFGRIAALADATKIYRFTYSGEQLGGVTVEARPRGDFFTLEPCRVLDTRTEGGPLASATPRPLQVGERCRVPAAAQAIAANVTVVPRGVPGRVTLLPADSGGNVSTLNFGAAGTRANNAVVPVGANGRMTLTAVLAGVGDVDVIVDVTGYFD